MNKHLHRTLVVMPLVLLIAGAAAAQTSNPSDAVEPVGKGTINWTLGEVYAKGIGAPPPNAVNAAQARAMAMRAAQGDAYRNLLETVKGVQVDSETVVENFMLKSDVIKTRVDGIVKGARIVKTQQLSDGSVEMLLAMPIKGAFLDVIVPETFGRPGESPVPQKPLMPQRPSDIKPAPPQPAPEKKAEPVKPEPAKPLPPAVEKKAEPVRPSPPPPQPEKKAEPLKPELPQPQPAPVSPIEPQSRPTVAFKGGKATGIVIDGRGLGLRPALLPKVVDPQGQEIYVGQVVTRTNAVEQGVAGYAKDVNAAANNFRVTDNPAVIKGQRASGAARTDVVLGQADAQALRDLGNKGDFLQNCRVIIVY